MKFKEEMEKFFKPYSVAQRKAVEEDPFYKGAENKSDLVKAQEIALEILAGNAKTKQEMRRKNLLSKYD